MRIIGMIAVTFGLLAAIKVINELKMTKAYDRQAAALERLADEAERGCIPARGR